MSNCDTDNYSRSGGGGKVGERGGGISMHIVLGDIGLVQNLYRKVKDDLHNA